MKKSSILGVALVVLLATSCASIPKDAKRTDPPALINSFEVSVELTLTPIQEDFEPAIIHFIKKLRASNLRILENPLSTQVYGEYDQVMAVLTSEIKEVFELMERGLLYIKIVKSDRYEYKPHF